VPRATVAAASGGVKKQVVGSGTGRGPEAATCACTACCEGINTMPRAAGRP
jgi:hypothetical protein